MEMKLRLVLSPRRKKIDKPSDQKIDKPSGHWTYRRLFRGVAGILISLLLSTTININFTPGRDCGTAPTQQNAGARA
jgi:hypothetical protein